MGILPEKGQRVVTFGSDRIASQRLRRLPELLFWFGANHFAEEKNLF
jgi:hypothetical protein